MPDWNDLENNMGSIVDDAAKKADEKLAARISSITKLSDKDIKDLCPSPGDVKALSDLMDIVTSARDRNAKINDIVKNSEKFGSIIFNLVSKFV